MSDNKLAKVIEFKPRQKTEFELKVARVNASLNKINSMIADLKKLDTESDDD